MNDCQKAEFLNFSSCTMNHRVLLTHKGTLVSVKCINSPSNQFVALLNEKWKINKSKYGCLSRTQGLWLKLKNNEERRKSMLAKDSRTLQCVCASLRERFQILRGMVLTSLDAWFLIPPNFQLLTKWWLGKKFSTIVRFTTEWSCSCTISTVLSKHLHSRKPSPRSYGCCGRLCSTWCFQRAKHRTNNFVLMKSFRLLLVKWLHRNPRAPPLPNVNLTTQRWLPKYKWFVFAPRQRLPIPSLSKFSPF